MAAPTLSTYQKAANAIYEPQKKADTIALQTTDTTTKNLLEAEKPQIATDYQSAIDKLTQTVKDQTAQINQLYSQRLGGNFSGLQGNDLGSMFARANEQQALISQTRANRLAQITAGETNADITMKSGIAALTPKYKSLETQYAQSAYGSAVKEYNAQKQRDFDNAVKLQNLQLSQARLGIEASRAANSGNSSLAKIQAQYKVKGKSSSYVDAAGNTVKNTSFSNGYAFTGPNGKPINMAEYISGAGLGGQDVVDLLVNGSSYDRNIAKKVQATNPKNNAQLVAAIKKYDTGHYYGF